MKYIFKPKEVEAIQWTGINDQEILNFVMGNGVPATPATIRKRMFSRKKYLEIYYDYYYSGKIRIIKYKLPQGCYLIYNGHRTLFTVQTQKRFESRYLGKEEITPTVNLDNMNVVDSKKDIINLIKKTKDQKTSLINYKYTIVWDSFSGGKWDNFTPIKIESTLACFTMENIITAIITKFDDLAKEKGFGLHHIQTRCLLNILETFYNVTKVENHSTLDYTITILDNLRSNYGPNYTDIYSYLDDDPKLEIMIRKYIGELQRDRKPREEFEFLGYTLKETANGGLCYLKNIIEKYDCGEDRGIKRIEFFKESSTVFIAWQDTDDCRGDWTATEIDIQEAKAIVKQLEELNGAEKELLENESVTDTEKEKEIYEN